MRVVFSLDKEQRAAAYKIIDLHNGKESAVAITTKKPQNEFAIRGNELVYIGTRQYIQSGDGYKFMQVVYGDRKPHMVSCEATERRLRWYENYQTVHSRSAVIWTDLKLECISDNKQEESKDKLCTDWTHLLTSGKSEMLDLITTLIDNPKREAFAGADGRPIMKKALSIVHKLLKLGIITMK